MAFFEDAKKIGCQARVLIVTAGMRDREMALALANGCSGIFLKHNPAGQLVEAIRRVMSGEIWLDVRYSTASRTKRSRRCSAYR